MSNDEDDDGDNHQVPKNTTTMMPVSVEEQDDDNHHGDVLAALPPPTPHRRPSHLAALIRESRRSLACFDPTILEDLEEEESKETDEEQQKKITPPSSSAFLIPTTTTMAVDGVMSDRMQSVRHRLSMMAVPEPHLVEVRFDDYSYSVPVRADAPTVKTIFNQSLCYGAYELIRRIHQYRIYRQQKNPSGGTPRRNSIWRPTKGSQVFNPYDQKVILKNIDLVFSPGKSYLVLGPPAGGKTSLLKAIAGMLLPESKKKQTAAKSKQGNIYYNGIRSDDERLVLPSLVSFVGQLDVHAPYLTVAETFQFAHESRVKQGADSERSNITLEGLDLAGCADTFVGNSDVRYVL
jgi:ABC-type glutathione transport system ATPase component